MRILLFLGLACLGIALLSGAPDIPVRLPNVLPPFSVNGGSLVRFNLVWERTKDSREGLPRLVRFQSKEQLNIFVEDGKAGDRIIAIDGKRPTRKTFTQELQGQTRVILERPSGRQIKKVEVDCYIP